MLDGSKFRIAGQDRCRQAESRGDAKGVRVGDRMVAFDLRRLSHQRQIYRHQFDGQLFQEMKRFCRPNRADLPLDDVEELAPMDPVEEGLSAGPLLPIQGRLDFLPTRFFMKEAHQRETIEDELFAHGAPPLDAPGEGRPLRRICL